MNKSWNEQILKSGCIVPKVNKQPIKPISFIKPKQNEKLYAFDTYKWLLSYP